MELARAVEGLQQEEMTITSEQLTHLSPMDWEHINLTGIMSGRKGVPSWPFVP
ncbi:Tn3 family transposase [Ktedonobacter sp. SOSP1-85]|uniref:Tn3 family transposase n=1 Tax=Ktedonobacter sp. SOSP1-85 TaxID=2778367 RepID=UPI0019163F38